MKQLLISFLCLTMALPTTAATAPKSKEVEAIQRFFRQVDQPEARSYRQMLQTMKPYAPREIVEHMESKLKERLDEQFPPYKLFDKGDHLELKFGMGRNVEVLSLLKKDPKVFARLRGVDILHADVAHGWNLIRKIESAFDPKPKSGKAALLWIESAHAFDWALFGGLAILAGGIGYGLYSLSRSKVKLDVPQNFTVTGNVNVPTSYSLDVPQNYNVDTNHSFTLPQLDKLLPGGQK
ncbi:MAG: hypothetical protein KF802_04400 [Bdellovibrionaceae bacterium]|nr:hypothetical protein [Pseudobdellovibrionaceae bacterium]